MTSRRATAAVCIAGAIMAASIAFASDGGDTGSEPGRITSLPDGYRTFELISVAHEAGSLNDIRAVLGNRIAIRPYRSGMRLDASRDLVFTDYAP